ncbi:MAG: hypothetical protein LBJ59_10940 [Zoogloeaceae bacterium]|jgi:hypothetical protein|nr:hypothetical protein [Zoogloeaceae bacterium]
MSSFATLWNVPGGTGLVFALLALLALVFLLRFVLPALLLQARLRRAIRALTAISGKGTPTPEAIAQTVMTTAPLRHLWREYAQTLHRQDGTGGKVRATAAAGHFFTPTALVDTPLNTGFYRHLPGILTGIGIIGTFAGLIAGLSHFEVNSNTDTVRLSLGNLIQGVGHAFQVSALAITLAMLATWMEKSLVTLACRLTARLAEQIDSLFESGVEEEYLARLVVASEQAARQGGDLRQALTGDLQKSLETLRSEQQQAQAKLWREMSVRLGDSIAQGVSDAVNKSLREPLARMAAAVEAVGKHQGEVAAHALEPLLSGFARRMEAQLGHGNVALEGLLLKSAEGMQRVTQEMGRVVARIDGMGQGAVSAAAEGLSHAGSGMGKAADNFAQASAQAGGQLLAASSALAQAAADANAVMQHENRNREAIAAMLAELRGILQQSRREATLTDDLIWRMEAAAQSLAAAKSEAGAYLEGVNQVLGEAHKSFAENIERTLSAGNQQFHKEMALAVDYLKGAIEALGDTLENLTAGHK